MAITKIIKIRTNVRACILYITNPDKTDEKLLVDSLGCLPESADSIFRITEKASKRNWEKSSKHIRAYHMIQSFSPDDKITPDEAQKIGQELMRRLLGNRYAYVMSTHIDKGHIHNHFVICPNSRDMTGEKLYDNPALLHKLQRTSDQLCRDHGLSVIDRRKGLWQAV